MDAEYFSTHRLTRKSDVYAFGVVLLEVLCGRPALDFTLDEEQHSLAGWGKHCIKRGNISRIVDPCLRGEVSVKCLKKFGRIAYECLRTCSKERPTMTVVLSRLELVLTWTMQSAQRASNWKNIAWSLFLTKTPRLVISNGKKDGCDNGGVATSSQQVVPPSGDIATLNLKDFTYSELQTATHNFQHRRVIGEGGFGKVFKGWLDRVTYTPQKAGDGIPVAIKKLNPESMQGLKEWQAEVFFGKFSHPNLVKVLGYCKENMELLIVYEFMQRGSLENHLFKKRVDALPWSTRIKIAIGAAQGMAFLHTAENNIISRDVKSSNILLDKDFNAKLSDFGLTQLGPSPAVSHVSTQVLGTFGYVAPVYLATGRLYVKSDVYGFGVVMLEIITGLRTLDPSRHVSKHKLVDWARPLLSDKKRIHRVMDSRLEKKYPMKAAHKTAELILTCLEPDPKNRPSMEEIVSCLQGINAIKMEPSQSTANTIKGQAINEVA
ncbi:putative transferase, protein kinase RLK-Pelle-RLCK-VIIa-2 family [Helianthus annuus]|nr:putative transferase, protein kinase RLK-Pelle-RLCK-VIIa-2 family [Helianthus annuus]